MEKTVEKKTGGMNSGALRIWGFFFLTMGIVGRGILQNNLLDLGNVSTQELFEAMEASQTVMLYATLSLALQAVETCAVPIFALLLVEGAKHTSDFTKYVIRVAGAALLSEIPYNLAMSGKVLELSSRNPVFGLFMALVVLWFFRKFEEKKAVNVLAKVIAVAAAMLWCVMLGIDFGASTVFIVAVLWVFRRKSIWQILMGAAATLLCGVFSMFFVVSPMSFLILHFYNGEQGSDNKAVNYLMYPIILLVLGIAGMYLV